MQEAFELNPVYTVMALLGTVLYLIKMVLLLVSGDFDADSDLTEVDGAGDLDGGATFSLISIQSILAFFMGAGWIGLACQQEWGMESLPSLLAASGFGFLMMLLSSFLTFKIKSLNSETKVDIREAKDKTGRAYTSIPPKGEGIGQVEITVGGKQQILQAMSTGEKIESFTAVKVIEVDDSGNLHVTKA